MDMAIYSHAGHKENIVSNDYNGWPEERRNGMKPHLQCPACRAPAYFRRKSRNGKAPCFVAHHESGCPKADSKDRIVFWAGKGIDVEGRLNEVYASAGTPSSLDPGLQALQAHSLDGLRKDDWT